jgi:hypothetical protein
MKHLICEINRLNGVRTVTTPDGYILVKEDPTQPSVAHKEAWHRLLKLYDELVEGERLGSECE